MIAAGDSAARNAFRVALRTETPPPIAASATSTQELDPNDILEVQDIAEAIARAERLLASPAPSSAASWSTAPNAPDSQSDLFASLGQRPTDDTSGPATPAPPYVDLPSAPLTAIDEDAFYHPNGRMRSLADVTLDGYRPEPTLLVRAASRRKRFSWFFLAALFPLATLAGVALFANAPIAAIARAPSTTATVRTALATTSPAQKLAPSTASTAGATPVFDVNRLPSARRPRTRR